MIITDKEALKIMKNLLIEFFFEIDDNNDKPTLHDLSILSELSNIMESIDLVLTANIIREYIAKYIEKFWKTIKRE